MNISDEEADALVHGLINEIRPYANELVDKYHEYWVQFNGDEIKTFRAMLLWISVGIEISHLDQKTLIALTAFTARRLHTHRPMLTVSRN